MERPLPPVPEIVTYYNFQELQAASQILPAPWIRISVSEHKIVVGVLERSLVKLQVTITSDFVATVEVYGFPVPGETTTMENEKLHNFLAKLSSRIICQGVVNENLQGFANMPSKGQLYFRHIVCKSSETYTSTVRSKDCLWLDSELCKNCRYVETLLSKKHERAMSAKESEVSSHNPLKLTNEALKKVFKQTRKHSSAVENKLAKFRKELSLESVPVSKTQHDSLKTVLSEKVGALNNPLTKLFWEEQLKAFSVKGKEGMRWHPMMVRLAILLHSRSPAAYDTLRKTGVLHLPGQSTLQDYTNVYKPSAGLSLSTINAIIKETKDFKDEQRFVALLHDEITIKSDLVFDQRSNELVGFVEGKEDLATHALVFYVIGITTNLKTSLGFFPTRNATAGDLYPLFWRAIGLLENKCGLKVVSSTSDKATPNQRLYDMQGAGQAYKTVNLFASDREVFFISDAPHLMKTVRNNLANSGSGTNTRYVWKNGKHLLWKHVQDVYHNDCQQELKRTRLTYHHVHLTPSSVMNVRLAVQVLSERVGKVMQATGGEECQETANLILMMDKLFDCLNVRSKDKGKQSRKPFLNPYTSVDDERFAFFSDVLSWLIEWRQAIQNRAGFSQAEKNRMFLSQQTFKGLCMTLRAFPELCRYLIQNGVEYVLSNRFCQDPLEQHFGRHRGIGRRCDNPSLWAFAYNENKLRIQRSLAIAIQPRGNTANKQESDIVISNSPMKKRKH
jgi:hypothetical protein